MSAKKPIEVKQVGEIKEVNDYVNFYTAWEHFKSDATPITTSVRDVMERARQFVDQLEVLRVSADKAVRDAGVSCGPFKMLQNDLSIDWDKVHATRGRAGFLAVGGTIKEKNDYKGDVNRYLAAKAKGMISPEEAEDYEGSGTRFQAIKPFNMP